MSTQRHVHEVMTPVPVRPGPLHHMNRLVVPPGRWAEYDPFLFLTEDIFAKGNFDTHPHRGLETVTVAVHGDFKVEDSSGEEWLFGPGDAQWTTAGFGVVHDEGPVPGDRLMHCLQWWINLPAKHKRASARYQNLYAKHLPVVKRPGVEIRIYSGELAGRTAPTINLVPIILADVRIATREQVRLSMPAGHNAFFYVLDGIGRVGPDQVVVADGQVAHLPPTTGTDSELLIASEADLRGILFAGEPLREPSTRPPYEGNPATQALCYADPDEPNGDGSTIREDQMKVIATRPASAEVLSSADWPHTIR